MKEVKLTTYVLTAHELVMAIEAMAEGSWRNGEGVGYIHFVQVVHEDNFIVTVKDSIEP